MTLAAFAGAMAVTAGNGLGSLDSLGLLQAHVEVRPSSNSPGGYKKYRQAMANYGEVQYVSTINVGRQTLNGIIDTGSFELTVFSRFCGSCGNAALYDPIQSASHRSGPLVSGQSYGSGRTLSQEAYDLVSIGPFNEINQSFWEVNRASMPVLYNSVFHCIIGVGPPEAPAADAWETMRETARNISELLDAGQQVPADTMTRAEQKLQIASDMTQRAPMLATFNTSMFSVCIGNKPDSDGFVVWNDTSALEQPELFTEVPVIGQHTWSVHMHNARLAWQQGAPGDSSLGLACEGGCSALIDSGTSLLALPSRVIRSITLAMNSSQDFDCSRISDLPSLTFEMGGQTFSLSPDVYMAEVAGTVPSYMQGYVRVRNLQRPGARCQLLVMESVASTPHGPLWILGLPFFRKYYTTFRVGASSRERKLLIANASEDCYPSAASSPPPGRSERWKRRVDPALLWVPLAVQNAVSSEFVRL
jgi:hypothetical protein